MIRFDHITKQYPGTSRPALNSIDVEILRGEFVFLVGASGSGKSSCLRLILKEERPTSGSIHVLGQDLRTISNRKVPYFRRNLGVVFQDFRLLPNKSVYDNVAFSLQVIGKSRGFIQEAVPDTLTMVGLAEKAQRLPHELSGGEQQRVAIARAIVNKPQVLLADEPTGNLDPTTSAGIMALLDRINAGGTTVVMATHEAGIVDQMQRRVIELSGGEIIRDERRGGYTTSAIPIITTTQPAAPRAAAAQPAGAQAPSVQATQPAAAATSEASTTVHPHAAAPQSPASTASNPMVDGEVAPATTAATVIVTPAPTTAAVPVATTGTGPVMPPRFAPPLRQTEPEQTAPEAHDEPLTHPPAGVSRDSGMPFWEPAPAAPAPTPDEPVAAAETTPDTDFDPDRPMTRPILSVTQHDEPEQLTLAEKLGLRAPGEKPNPTGEQNVGPTR